MALGLSPVFTLTTDLIVSAAPPERAGAAAAISETGAEFGGVLGIAVLGSIGIAVYRSMMELTPADGIPAALLEVSKDTLGGAVAAASELRGEVGIQLVASARDAFSSGFTLVVALCALIAVGGAIVAAVLLRGAGGGSGSDEESTILGADALSSAPEKS
jgi:DHA2 family multidrug resistance protein-like MFS transporter